MSPKLKNILTIAFLLDVGYTSIAQGVDTGGPPPPGSIPSLPGLVVPIDQNIILLLLLGLFTGIVYFLRSKYSKV